MKIAQWTILIILAALNIFLVRATIKHEREMRKIYQEFNKVGDYHAELRRSEGEQIRNENFEPDSLNFYTEEEAFFGSKIEVENTLGQKVSFTYPSTFPSDTAFNGVKVKSPGELRHGYRTTVTTIGGEVIQFVTSDRGLPYTEGNFDSDLLFGCSNSFGPVMEIFSTRKVVPGTGAGRTICS